MPEIQPWSPLPSRTSWSNPNDAVAQFRSVFDGVVDRLLDVDSELAAELSGGLDSSMVVATAAQSPVRGGRVLTAFVSVPLQCAVLPRSPRVNDEWVYAQALATQHPGAIDLVPVSNTTLRQPLDAAAEASAQSWWPCFAPANQVWLDSIRESARGLNTQFLINGQHGNWSFSWYGRPTSLRRRAGYVLRGRPIPGHRAARDRYVSGLTGHSSPHAAALHPFAVEGLWRADPFTARPVIDVAARLPPNEWGMEPWPRGFARAVARGRVPDVIRLRQARGAQAPDVWTWIKDQQERYRHEVEMFAQTELLDGAVDIAELRSTVAGWPWGEPAGPSMQSMSRVHRVLALGGYVRMMEQKLSELPAAPTLPVQAPAISSAARTPER